MKIKNTVLLMGLGLSLAFAQYDFEVPGTTEEASSAAQDSATAGWQSAAPAAPEAPAVAAPSFSPTLPKPQLKATPAGDVAMLRSQAWAQVYGNNPARPHDINHALSRPSLFGGLEMVMFQTDGGNHAGTMALNGMGGTIYSDMRVARHPRTNGAYDNSLFTMGYSAAGAFGAGLRFGFNRDSYELTPKLATVFKEEESNQYAGDQFGLVGSAQAGDFGIFGSFDIVTPGPTPSGETVEGAAAGNTTEERSFNDMVLQLGARMDANANNPNAFEARLFLHSLSREAKLKAPGGTVTTKNADHGTYAGLDLGYGSKAKQAEDFELLWGANLQFVTQLLNDGQAANAHDSAWMQVGITPNLAFAYQFTENLRGVVSARHLLAYDISQRLNNETAAADAPRASEESASTLQNNPTNVALALSYRYKRVSFEAMLSNYSLQEGPSILFDRSATAPTLFSSVGITADLR